MAGNDIGRRIFKKETNTSRPNEFHNTFRNESLERILGKEKAITLFGQLEKINSMENLKMNRNNHSTIGNVAPAHSQSIQQYTTGRFAKHLHISGRPMNTQPYYEED